jgi:hypothetical protein
MILFGSAAGFIDLQLIENNLQSREWFFVRIL